MAVPIKLYVLMDDIIVMETAKEIYKRVLDIVYNALIGYKT